MNKESLKSESGMNTAAEWATLKELAENWLKLMAKVGVAPKGIVLYDDDRVQTENFATRFEGDHRELSDEIGRAVDVDGDFWRREMGMDPREMSRSGHVGQALLESEVRHDRSLRMVDGGLKVVGDEMEL